MDSFIYILVLCYYFIKSIWKCYYEELVKNNEDLVKNNEDLIKNIPGAHCIVDSIPRGVYNLQYKCCRNVARYSPGKHMEVEVCDTKKSTQQEAKEFLSKLYLL